MWNVKQNGLIENLAFLLLLKAHTGYRNQGIDFSRRSPTIRRTRVPTQQRRWRWWQQSGCKNGLLRHTESELLLKFLYLFRIRVTFHSLFQ